MAFSNKMLKTTLILFSIPLHQELFKYGSAGISVTNWIFGALICLYNFSDKENIPIAVSIITA